MDFNRNNINMRMLAGLWLHFTSLFLVISRQSIAAELNKYKFPEKFKFGVATSSYQIEGGWNASDKSPNIWDYAVHKNPDLILNRDNGDVACDSYHRYKEDVALLRELEVDFYRFSLSWSRILPNGIDNKVSKDGVKYYKNLISELLKNNIEPFVTIYHWDLPQILQDYGGFLNESMVDWYVAYARVCFQEFGKDVKIWLTFNEPKQVCLLGYGVGIHAPFIRAMGLADYVCGHNLLKAHAKTWHMYNDHFRKIQGGRLGITIDSEWYEPASNRPEDAEAVERMLQFMFGWWANPIIHQDYPSVMKAVVARHSSEEGFEESRLPAFTKEELQNISGTYDFLGVNIYSAAYVTSLTNKTCTRCDAEIDRWQSNDWEKSNSEWLKVTPWAIRKLLKWIKNTYGNPEIIITENGYSDDDSTMADDRRINFLQKYLRNIHDAMELDGVNVTGYTVWSLLDNLEWRSGFSERFGLFRIDYTSPNRTRTKKKSATWYKNVIKTKYVLD